VGGKGRGYCHAFLMRLPDQIKDPFNHSSFLMHRLLFYFTDLNTQYCEIPDRKISTRHLFKMYQLRGKQQEMKKGGQGVWGSLQ
jgi:hypothetical protein